MTRHLLALTISAFLAACASTPTGPTAVAALQPTKGNSVSGPLQFAQRGPLGRVSGEITGLKPNAEHGLAIVH